MKLNYEAFWPRNESTVSERTVYNDLPYGSKTCACDSLILWTIVNSWNVNLFKTVQLQYTLCSKAFPSTIILTFLQIIDAVCTWFFAELKDCLRNWISLYWEWLKKIVHLNIIILWNPSMFRFLPTITTFNSQKFAWSFWSSFRHVCNARVNSGFNIASFRATYSLYR